MACDWQNVRSAERGSNCGCGLWTPAVVCIAKRVLRCAECGVRGATIGTAARQNQRAAAAGERQPLASAVEGEGGRRGGCY